MAYSLQALLLLEVALPMTVITTSM